ncbi:NUDIX hydrolase [Paragemmobacter ruber]|uniref:NUDIX domain-containing protein n=1 Tax=Paragemmobacter ruber TaxID=1985673 RepID=A0ABW9YAL4_9RHOB|nr:NUDIX hydrolase [Rhodobacter ruber]NBE09661.1 NUDIX domain-containing protein [Rhodobacter ruber]
MTIEGGFVGAKAALFCGHAVLTLLRDTHPGLPWPGMWDLPGGGREGDESPEDCLLRELDEEFGLRLPPSRLTGRWVLPSLSDASRQAVFFSGVVTRAEVAAIRFGTEGQGWALMPCAEFLAHPKAVPGLQDRLRLALSAQAIPQ